MEAVLGHISRWPVEVQFAVENDLGPHRQLIYKRRAFGQ